MTLDDLQLRILNLNHHSFCPSHNARSLPSQSERAARRCLNRPHGPAALLCAQAPPRLHHLPVSGACQCLPGARRAICVLAGGLCVPSEGLMVWPGRSVSDKTVDSFWQALSSQLASPKSRGHQGLPAGPPGDCTPSSATERVMPSSLRLSFLRCWPPFVQERAGLRPTYRVLVGGPLAGVLLLHLLGQAESSPWCLGLVGASVHKNFRAGGCHQSIQPGPSTPPSACPPPGNRGPAAGPAWELQATSSRVGSRRAGEWTGQGVRSYCGGEA